VAIIAEDGTGKVDAEAYCTLAEATAYHAAYGNAAWAALPSDAVREAALRKATDFMVGRFRPLWNGSRKTVTQALDWPRSLVLIKDAISPSYYDDSSVPTPVKNACASLALRAAAADLLADEGQVKLSVSVGSISTTYDPNSPVAKQYKEIDAMLAPYLQTGAGKIKMVRV
jgi:hypothetical protein